MFDNLQNPRQGHPHADDRTADEAKLRATLRSIPVGKDFGLWWATDSGKWLLTAISDQIGGSLSSYLWKTYAHQVEVDEIVNTAVEVLANLASRASIIEALSPWGYLYTVLKHALAKLTGEFFRDDINDELVSRMVQQQQQQGGGVVHSGTTATASFAIGEAERLTADCLRPLTPARVLPYLDVFVRYFSEEGESRISRALGNATKEDKLRQFQLHDYEIRAIGNAVLGSRPDYGTNSLLAGFILDKTFDPRRSDNHFKAMVKFERRIRGIALL